MGLTWEENTVHEPVGPGGLYLSRGAECILPMVQVRWESSSFRENTITACHLHLYVDPAAPWWCEFTLDQYQTIWLTHPLGTTRLHWFPFVTLPFFSLLNQRFSCVELVFLVLLFYSRGLKLHLPVGRWRNPMNGTTANLDPPPCFVVFTVNKLTREHRVCGLFSVTIFVYLMFTWPISCVNLKLTQ